MWFGLEIREHPRFARQTRSILLCRHAFWPFLALTPVFSIHYSLLLWIGGMIRGRLTGGLTVVLTLTLTVVLTGVLTG